MEEGGWLQGSFVSAEDVKTMIEKFDVVPKNDALFLIVASQSCDVANVSEKNVEFSIATEISKLDGNFMFNKHPRLLHIPASNESGIREFPEFYLQLVAHEKISISKEKLLEFNIMNPCIATHLDVVTTRGYVDWLASRYKRPALPTEFDRRFDHVWQRKKREKRSGRLSEFIQGIYIEIDPFEEIQDSEIYNVNLLAIITEDAKEDSRIFKDIEELIKAYADTMQEANIEVVTSTITTEKGISLARFKRYKRFNMDSLSYKNDHPLPSELTS